MKRTISFFFGAYLLISIFNSASAQNNNDIVSVQWAVDNLNSIGGYKVTVIGSPEVVATKFGKGLQFNGVDGGIIIHGNPLDEVAEFTIEVVFMPISSNDSSNIEQRFLHIQNPVNADRRILIELRLAENNKWFLDTFIKSDTSRLALYAEKHLHPADQWYHAALVFSNGQMKHFVNGLEELAGEINFLPIINGNISLGMRMDNRSWFKGIISHVRMTNKALNPELFNLPSED